jgi:undecaprenyl-diphosphatase
LTFQVFLEYLPILIISAIEGLTEFLPISSTAHILFLGHIFDIQLQMEYIVSIQLGAILAVFFLYNHRIKIIIHEIRTNKPQLITTLIIITIPAIIVGSILHIIDFLHFIPIKLMQINLILGGVLMLIFRKSSGENNNIMNISHSSALKIGLFQIIALIPGVSRSASIIFGGIFSGLSKQCAIEVSFLSGLPIITAASFLEIYSGYSRGTSLELTLLTVNVTIAFIFSCIGIVCLKWMVKYNRDFEIFGFYRIIIGSALFFII